jgi:uncharacterized protein YbaR (Trm112 family)
MLSADLISLLRCPESGQRLRIATAREIALTKFGHGLIREDGRVVYPIEDDIPLVMIEHAVRITPAAGSE